jgi:hypothetical protein
MNFKSLALTSVLALGSIFGSVSPAEAKASHCYLGDAGTQLATRVCNVDRRVNNNGHIVFDISGPVSGTVVLWDDGTAEWVTANGVSTFVTENLSDGYVRMINTANNFNFVFTTR